MKAMRVFGMCVIMGVFVSMVFKEAGPWTGLSVATLFVLQLTSDSCVRSLLKCCEALNYQRKSLEAALRMHAACSGHH